MGFTYLRGGIASGGTASLQLGQPNNVFGETSGSGESAVNTINPASDLTTAIATRNAYESANSNWVNDYASGDVYIILFYVSNSNRVVQYQRRSGSQWINFGQPIIALRGMPGQDGSAMQLPANAQEGDLLKVTLASGTPALTIASLNETDEEIQSSKTVKVPSGSIDLTSTLISSAVQTLALRNVLGERAVIPFTAYDDTNGHIGDFVLRLGVSDTLDINTANTQVVTTPFSREYTTQADNLTVNFFVRPATSGELTVQYYLVTGRNPDGTPQFNSDEPIYSETRNFTQTEVDSGVPVGFGVGNPYALEGSTNIYVTFDGIDLRGGPTPAGDLLPTGDVAPYFTSSVLPYELERIITENELTHTDHQGVSVSAQGSGRNYKLVFNVDSVSLLEGQLNYAGPGNAELSSLAGKVHVIGSSVSSITIDAATTIANNSFFAIQSESASNVSFSLSGSSLSFGGFASGTSYDIPAQGGVLFYVSGTNIIPVSDVNRSASSPPVSPGPGSLYYGLSGTNNPSSVDLATLTEVVSATDPQSISIGPTSSGDYLIVLSDTTRDATRITDHIGTIVYQNPSDPNVANIFTKTDNVRTDNGVTFDAYVVGPLVADLSETYTLRFS